MMKSDLFNKGDHMLSVTNMIIWLMAKKLCRILVWQTEVFRVPDTENTQADTAGQKTGHPLRGKKGAAGRVVPACPSREFSLSLVLHSI